MCRRGVAGGAAGCMLALREAVMHSMEAAHSVAHPSPSSPLTICCSDRSPLNLVPVMSALLSRAATAAKAQQEPQLPWFLTGVTLPRARQSHLAGTVCCSLRPGLGTGAASTWVAPAAAWAVRASPLAGRIRRVAWKSSQVRSAVSVRPLKNLASGRELWAITSSTAALKAAKAAASRAGEA